MVRNIACVTAAVLALAALPALAGERNEFWPELDGYFTLGERTRLFVGIAKTRAEETETTTGGTTQYQDMQVGVHLDITLTPLLRPALSQADWQRNRYLWMRVGYRYGRSLGDAETTDRFRENRGIFELTGRTPPLAGGVEVVARFRWDAREVNDVHSDRYRLRFGIEKALSLGGRAVVPFANAEIFYDTRFDTWNRQRYQLGAEFEINRTWRLEPSLYRQNDSRSEPAHINAFGLALKYFH